MTVQFNSSHAFYSVPLPLPLPPSPRPSLSDFISTSNNCLIGLCPLGKSTEDEKRSPGPERRHRRNWLLCGYVHREAACTWSRLRSAMTSYSHLNSDKTVLIQTEFRVWNVISKYFSFLKTELSLSTYKAIINFPTLNC